MSVPSQRNHPIWLRRKIVPQMDPQTPFVGPGPRDAKATRQIVGNCCAMQKPANLRLGLPDVDARDGARNDQALNFRSPFEDRVDLRVTVPALDGIFAHVAVTAQDLDRLFGDLDRRLARVELGHRALTVKERLAGRGHPRRTPHQKARRVDVHFHVGELERDPLVLDDGATELLALLRVVERELVRRARDAERLSADRGTRRLEGRHRGLTRGLLALTNAGQLLFELVLPSEQAVARYPTVLEHYLC